MSPSDRQGLRYGQIVLATVSDGHGNTKNRPVVIVTPTAVINSDRQKRRVLGNHHRAAPLIRPSGTFSPGGRRG